MLPVPPLLVISDRRQARRPLEQVATAAFTGGCRWFSLREKDLSPQKLSYTIGTLLQVDRAGKQAILEIPTTTERLQHEAELLEAELQQLSLLAHSQRQETTPPPYWSMN